MDSIDDYRLIINFINYLFIIIIYIMVVNCDDLLKKILIELVDYYFPNKQIQSPGRPLKCTNDDCIDAMFYVLKTGIGWEYLNGYSIKGDSIRKRCNKWINIGIPKMAWIILRNIYIEFKLDFKDLYMDASHIKNYNGCDKIGRNLYDRFKTSTKLSIITDNNGIPIGITLDSGNRHDVMLVEKTLESIDFGLLDYMDTEYLIADKGYCSNELEKKIETDCKLKLITPTKRSTEEVNEEKTKIKELNKVKQKIKVEERKLEKNMNKLKLIKTFPVNQRNNIRKNINNNIRNKKLIIKQLKITKKEKERIKKKRGRKSIKDIKLAGRYIVELSFSWFKKYGRLVIRKDKNFSNFEGFIFLGAANIIARSLSKIN